MQGRFDAAISWLAGTDDSALDVLRELRAAGDLTPFLMLTRAADAELVYRSGTLGVCQILELPQLNEAALRGALADLVGPLAPTEAPRAAEFTPAMPWKTDAAGEFTHFTRRWSLFHRPFGGEGAGPRLVRRHPPRRHLGLDGDLRGSAL